MTARWINAALGAWLFTSAFLWPHSEAQFDNTWIVGVLIAAFALVASAGQAWARYVNVAAAVWLFFSTLFLPRTTVLTLWHNVVVAIAVLVFALRPTEMPPKRRPGRLATSRT